MEAPSESETLNGDTKSPRSCGGVLELVATTPAEEDNAVGSQDASQASYHAEPDDTHVHDASIVQVASTPPYWKSHDRTRSTASDVSISNLAIPAIQLEDHSDEYHEVGRACWAKHVTIEDYVVIGGGAIAGAYVVWNCTVETLKGAPFMIRKR